MQKKPFTKRLKCPTCGKRTSVYCYPNGVRIPTCGCNGWFEGTPPFRELPDSALDGCSFKYESAYLWEGPSQEEFDRANGT